MTRHAIARRQGSARGGFALVVVILVLGALLVLCAPFLMTAHSSDRASAELFDRAQARIALDSASAHARARLGRSYPGLDETFFYDSLEELQVSNRFADGFLDPNDPNGVMWDLRVEDVAGLVDLASAPPQLFANLIGGATRLARPVEDKDTELQLASVAGLDPAGIVWIEGEYVRYGRIEENRLVELQRGLGAQQDADGNPLPGPRPASAHGVGAQVLDQRAFAPALWRLRDGEVRPFDSYEQLRELDEYVLAEGGLGAHALQRLSELGTVYGHVKGGAVWQRASRIVSNVSRDQDATFQAEDTRWFNEGATVRITDGRTTELGVVVRVSGGGTVYLDRAFASDYEPYSAVAEVLARRPVNVNTAPPAVLEAIFDGLKVRGRNQRVTGSEARELAALAVAARPFTGFEDYLRRFVLPAAGIEPPPDGAERVPDVFARGGTVIDEVDALALYANALNANDALLEVSTVPFCFSSRDVYRTDLRAAVNAPSGVERFSVVRDEVRVVAPQEELFYMWARQEDFDRELRLTREGAWWLSGPFPTSRIDASMLAPPSRLWAHMGTVEGQPFLPGVVEPELVGVDARPVAEHIFASQEADVSFAQLMPVREYELGRRQGRMMHFDHETRELEGRYLPHETIARPTDDAMLEWTAGTGLARGLSFSAWIRPRAAADAVLLDVGGSSTDADRVSLLFEGGDLVLRALDGGGDHRETPGFREAAELRYSIAPGDGPGLPIDVWHHVFVDVRGSRPSDLTMLVNGMAHGVRAQGLTRLTGAVGETSSVLPVESTEGFPQRGVARIGNELVEYTLTQGALNAVFTPSGPDAGFGGRNARVAWIPGTNAVPANLGTINLNHPVGTPVEHYGYALELASDLPAGQASLPANLGPFRCAVVVGLEGGSTALGDEIVIPQGIFTFTAPGMEGAGSSVTGLVLDSADAPGSGSSDVMSAFNPQGGYAAIVQGRWRNTTTVQGSAVGGVEVIRYSGYSGNTLQIAARGNSVTELRALQAADATLTGGARAFITDWSGWNAGGVPITSRLRARTFVFPISLPVQGAQQSFLVPAVAQQGGASFPEFAQILRTDAAELTEWVAYDEIASGQLVRDGLFALEEAYQVLTTNRDLDPPDRPLPGQPGGGPGTPGGIGGGGGGGGTGGGGGMMMRAATPSPAAPSPAMTAPGASAASTALAGAIWEPFLGQPEDLQLPLTRALRERFQFRGALGTHTATHSAGTPVLPVFRVYDRGPDGGQPGRYDPVFVMGADFTSLGWPLVVHRGHSPSQAVVYHPWDQTDPATPLATATGEELFVTNNVRLGEVYVALNAPCPQAMTAGSFDPTGQALVEDTRALTRLLKHPSGERARDVRTASVGAGFQAGAGAVASAVVDELLFDRPEATMNADASADRDTMSGACLELRQDFAERGPELSVYPRAVRIPRGLRGSTAAFLSNWRQQAGLVRVGQEILAYDALDDQTGGIRVAQGGWGLLGTQPQPHEIGETVHYLEGLVVGVLAGTMQGGTAVIPLTDAQDFPPAGTVLIGQELLHYTRKRGNVLEMPVGSREPGAMDQQGEGLFRGRYGTAPAGHNAGEPVILFPARYWDRWSPRADAPELTYFGFRLEEPAAWWRTMFFEEESSGVGGSRVGLLMRSDPSVPWDSDPDLTDGLWRYELGDDQGRPHPIGLQSDQLEWRVFVEYLQGAFDPVTGNAHGWRATPRLRALGVEYIAPGAVLRSVER